MAAPFQRQPLRLIFIVTPGIAIQALVFAIVIGALGGWLPARQAMRVSVVNA